MKASFRQSMTVVHTWSGLLAGWLLYFVFLTGTAGYFNAEIDRWMQPERPLMTPAVPAETALAAARDRLKRVAPRAERWFIELPGARAPDLTIFWRGAPGADGNAGASGHERLDPETGRPVTYRETGGGQLLYRMHYRLHYLPARTAYWIVGICTMAMLLAIVTGVIVHKRIFRDFFLFRAGRGQRSWLDAHNLLSVLALPFHLMITYSGLMFFAYLYMAPVVAATYGIGETAREAYFDELLGRDAIPEPAARSASLAPLEPMVRKAEQRLQAQGVRFVNVFHPGDANARVAVFGGPLTPSRDRQEMLFDGTDGSLLRVSVPAATRW